MSNFSILVKTPLIFPIPWAPAPFSKRGVRVLVFGDAGPEQSLVLFYSLLLKFRIDMVVHVLGVQRYTKKGIAIWKTRIAIYIAIHLVK